MYLAKDGMLLVQGVEVGAKGEVELRGIHVLTSTCSTRNSMSDLNVGSHAASCAGAGGRYLEDASLRCSMRPENVPAMAIRPFLLCLMVGCISSSKKRACSPYMMLHAHRRCVSPAHQKPCGQFNTRQQTILRVAVSIAPIRGHATLSSALWVPCLGYEVALHVVKEDIVVVLDSAWAQRHSA